MILLRASVCVVLLFSLLLSAIGCGSSLKDGKKTGNVIFVHPDGTSSSAWTALRLLDKGPDGYLNWDRMPHLGVYRGHLLDSPVSSSNGGATVHAFGVKARYNEFGIHPDHPIRSLSGYQGSIMTEAIEAGLSTGVINSGHLAEPGSAVFLASVANRDMTDDITLQLIESGTDLILGGGEVLLLPEGEAGRHGAPGQRKDGLNLIKIAREKGYTIVYDREELNGVSPEADRILGVFAAYHTFHDLTEEELLEQGLPQYEETAPSVAEMTVAALDFLERKNKRFILVVEEEGTDNFGNHNNASGMLEALRRADETLGVVMGFVDRNPETMLITAADSNAGGMQVMSLRADQETVPPVSRNGAPLDGSTGCESRPFLAAPDRSGLRHPFALGWACLNDMEGGVLAKTYGMNAHLLPVNVDNTDIYRLMYRTLFGEELE